MPDVAWNRDKPLSDMNSGVCGQSWGGDGRRVYLYAAFFTDGYPH
jgi:hypothetical protein